jgi:GNAT superfamily N-acetyltransferase
MKQHYNKKSSERLRIKQLQGHSVHTIEGNNPRSLELLTKAYKDVYEAAFPIDEERESLETWLGSLAGNNPAANIVIVVAGEGLDTKAPVLKAISVAYYYNKQDAGLLAYNAVSPDFQGQGLGRTMVEARKAALLDIAGACGKPLGGVFIECNDPAKISREEDVMDPATRIRMFEKWGALTLPIDYVQPPLEVGSNKCDTLKLLAYPHPKTGKYPSKSEIQGFLNGIYTELAKYSGMKPAENPDYINSIGQLDQLNLEAFYKATLSKKSAPRKNQPKNN